MVVRDTGIELMSHWVTAVVYSPFMTEDRRVLLPAIGIVGAPKPLHRNS
jgi:hypothetical protein